MSVKKIGKTEVQKDFDINNTWCVEKVGFFSLDRRYLEKQPEIIALGEQPQAETSSKTDFWGNRKQPSIINQDEIDNYFYNLKEVELKITIEANQKSNIEPIPVEAYKQGSGWLYKGSVYRFDRSDYSTEEMLLQIMQLEDKERQKFERLKHKFTLAEQEEKKSKREPIPEEVRIAVWRRDDGKCVKCGSRERLEYDHIVPVSLGGSNTVRNIELLCEACNREKSNNIQ